MLTVELCTISCHYFPSVKIIHFYIFVHSVFIKYCVLCRIFCNLVNFTAAHKDSNNLEPMQNRRFNMELPKCLCLNCI